MIDRIALAIHDLIVLLRASDTDHDLIGILETHLSNLRQGRAIASDASAQNGTVTNPAEPKQPSLAIRCACDIASGAATDVAASGISSKGAWRDINAKGNGSETYRRALSPGGSWRFVSSDRLPRGVFLAGDRKAIVRGDVFSGDLIADYDRSLSRGTSQGEAKHDNKIGLVIGPRDNGGADIEWMEVTRQKDGTWRVVLPTGAHLTFPSPAWR